ncbi:hypothetical protein [Streptomyces noursei]|uniref:hypothetical protein n=1 Tax=Streptomyces noursei TaxID=1971 RepID=UPI0023B780B4|nr:hypothetical protein [Streptomyces noursei]
MPQQHQGGANAVGLIDFAALPASTGTTVLTVAADDGAVSRGFLYSRGDERTVVVVSHPRGDMSHHYAAPAVLEAGYAFYAHQPRSFNNDVDIEHERLLLDLAAGLRRLKAERGYQRIVFLGNSGGGSLLAFYQQQAGTAPPGRLTDTASGDPLDLNGVDMPTADGLVLLAAHPGQGTFMMTAIDPSVVDEDDPLAVDPELDMYHPANGFREPPEPSRYAPEFLDRYRAAQRERVARLDARARAQITEQRHHLGKMEAPGFSDLPLEERNHITRRAVVGQYMVVHRTEADPAYLDVSLHSWKSTRKPASILGPRPDRTNYAPGGFGRLVTPRAWLSTWSGLSTRARLIDSVQSVHDPLLMISLTSDNLCFPDEIHAQFDASPAEDKTMRFVDAEHFATPLPKRAEALRMVVEWLVPRFPAARNQ